MHRDQRDTAQNPVFASSPRDPAHACSERWCADCEGMSREDLCRSVAELRRQLVAKATRGRPTYQVGVGDQVQCSGRVVSLQQVGGIAHAWVEFEGGPLAAGTARVRCELLSSRSNERAKVLAEVRALLDRIGGAT